MRPRLVRRRPQPWTARKAARQAGERRARPPPLCVIVAATGAKLAATRRRHPGRSAARRIIRPWRPAIIRLTDRYAALRAYAPEQSAAAVNHMARKFRRAMRKATHRAELDARAARWRDEAEARARRIYLGHELAEELRKAAAGADAEARKPAAPGRQAAPRPHGRT